MKVVYSRNIFIDSEINVIGNGEQLRINFPPQPFSIGGNQKMRLVLNAFEMRRNWHSINQTNNEFYLHDKTANRFYPVEITAGSYRSFNDLAVAIQSAVNTALAFAAAGGVNTVNSQTYAANPAYAGVTSTVVWNTTSRKFTLTLSSVPAGTDIQFAFFQVKDTSLKSALAAPNDVTDNGFFNDSHEILGGSPTRDKALAVGAVTDGLNETTLRCSKASLSIIRLIRCLRMPAQQVIRTSL